jgi:hypothetical protein
MRATQTAGRTLDTQDPTPIRHIGTATPRSAELASTCISDLHIVAIVTADPDISIIGMMAGIVIGKVAPFLPTQRVGWVRREAA